MKVEIKVNPNYSHLSDFIGSIPHNFDQLGEVIFSGRNEIRGVHANELHITIKYFRRIFWANRIIFATIRKSKAQRSFENSNRLLANGIDTPVPIAYINTYRFGLLYKSYYICLFSDLKPIKELFALPIPLSENGLKAFARFSFKLHELGIFHNDFNLSNILYRQAGQEYTFSLIDNNRIKFSEYTTRKGLKNLRRLPLPADRVGIVGEEYAKAANTNNIWTLFAMILFRLQFQNKRFFQKSLKKLLRPKLPIHK